MTVLRRAGLAAVQALLVGVAVLAVAAVIGTGVWFLQRLQAQLRATSQHLQETETSLTQSQGTVEMLESERRKLAEDYETLKGRFTKADEERQQAAHTVEKQTADLEELSKQRGALERQLEAAKGQQGTLKTQTEALYKNIAETEAKRAALEHQLTDATGRVRELQAQADRLAAAQQAGDDQLREQLAALSRAYERLASARRAELAQRAAAGTPGSGGMAQERPRRWASREQAARHYNDLGEAFLAAERYQEAVEAFERSVHYRDDAAVHAKLAFIYSRLLPDAEGLQHHTIVPPDEYASGMEGNAAANGMPRSGWRQLWDWLSGR